MPATRSSARLAAKKGGSSPTQREQGRSPRSSPTKKQAAARRAAQEEATTAAGGGGGAKTPSSMAAAAPTWLLALALVLGLANVAFKAAFDLPLEKLFRNIFMAPTPPPVAGKYSCTPESIAADVTVVVTVKDACSQAPGFIHALNRMMPTQGVHLIYTFPNFSSCASIPGMEEELKLWRSHGQVTKLPLEPRVSPMQGWVDAVDHITTPYALLLHNDGYALDEFFACELVGALKARKLAAENGTAGGAAGASGGTGGPFVVSAPMLYESKADKSLAAHATQSNLRLVTELDKATNRTVRHDHSVARALNRGKDVPEGPQSEFLEDHGFMIETDKIRAVIDPHASYTLEYIDMIMTIRSHGWQVLFVPTARLEFRITEFSWRDIPYFMYKRSEATCHGTRDYLTAKWGADFPNTGFWTYIKYTIVEQHVYDEAELSALTWAQSASIAFGFFQMVGFNRYQETVSKPDLLESPAVDFIEILQRLERGWAPADAADAPYARANARGRVVATRELKRRAWAHNETKRTEKRIGEILETRGSGVVKIEADMPLEYLPFAVLELSFPLEEEEGEEGKEEGVAVAGGAHRGGKQQRAVRGERSAALFAAVQPLCGLLVHHAKAPSSPEGGGGSSLSCWVNLPTFKSNSGFIRFLDRLAALIKLPSRVTTYVEMFMGSTRPAAEHVAALRALLDEQQEAAAAAAAGVAAGAAAEGDFPAVNLVACEHDGDCEMELSFGRHSRVLQFVGKPPSAWELVGALSHA